MGPIQAEVYMEELQKHGWEKSIAALKLCFRNLKGFPTINEILAQMGIAEPDKKDESNVICGKIIQAISRFGGYQAESAKSFIGDLGWEAVSRFGGWSTLCMSQESDLTAIRAQLRDMIKAVAAYDSVGRLHERKSLGATTAAQDALQMDALLRQLQVKK